MLWGNLVGWVGGICTKTCHFQATFGDVLAGCFAPEYTTGNYSRVTVAHALRVDLALCICTGSSTLECYSKLHFAGFGFYSVMGQPAYLLMVVAVLLIVIGG